MASSSGWRILTSSLKVRGSPTLLIKHEITTSNTGKFSSLKVCVTDLIYLWMQTLERRELVRIACDTEIDPVEQFDTLLEYLGKGLNSAPTTTLSISSQKGRSHLVLHLKTPLPKPLKPLEWKFDLLQASEMDFTREFVVTLLGSLYRTQGDVQDLDSVIAEKDLAIKKIETGLQACNSGLTDLFDKRVYGESVAERHKKATLLNKIPGLRPFDPSRWQNERHEVGVPSIRDVNKSIFAQALYSGLSADSLAQEAWWEDLGRGIEVDEPSQISQPAILHRESTTAFECSQFHGNGTHAIRRHGGLRSSSPVDANPTSNGNAENQEDSDATASIASDVETPAPSTPVRRIGKIGGNKLLQEQRKASEPEDSSRRETRPVFESTDHETNESRPKGRIGRIGGVRSTHIELAKDLSQSDQLPTRSAAIVEDSEHAGPSRRPKVQETTEEHANRRRAELKHDLEEKRKAPVKKKRKF